MRKTFATTLRNMMREDESIYLVTADLGYGLFDEIRASFPDRFINVQAAEQAMVLVAVGLALEGKKPYCYSITPFLLLRPAEMIHLYLQREGLPVVLVGSGRGMDYKHDGVTHWEPNEYTPLSWKNYWPATDEDVSEYLTQLEAPYYINLKR